MPSSPLSLGTAEEAGPLQEGLAEMDALIDQGVSFSGHERNCAFLNVPLGEGKAGRRFVTASAALGLDFDDDARAPAFVDWDRDGDLDLWMANRSGPMLRFLKNEQAREASWVALRLKGQRANRDGIGSRVEVRLGNGRRLVQTLKAGEGYLAQSSKWLHFGLGSADSIESVHVRWAGGEAENFAGMPVRGRYLLVEGSGIAQGVPAGAVKLPDTARQPGRAEVEGRVRSVTVSGWPLPRLPYTTFDGQAAYAGGATEGLTLVNLWATWCQPCQRELRALAERAADLKQAGISVVALSVDEVAMEGGGVSGSGVTPQAFYRRLQVPFAAGLASEELVRRLEFAYAQLFGLRWPLPVPTSVLLDGKGVALAFYKGEVSVDTLLQDAATSRLEQEARHDEALPFAGQWFRRPQPLGPLSLGLDLMEQDQVDDAYELAFRVPEVLAERSREYGKFLTWIGDALIKRPSRVQDALKAYRAAVKHEPENVIVLNNLAWQLAAHPQAKVRNGKEAVQWAEKAATLTGQRDPAVLDTLAAAYAEAGDFQRAVAAATKAASLARQQGKRALWEGIQASLAKFRQGQTVAD